MNAVQNCELRMSSESTIDIQPSSLFTPAMDAAILRAYREIKPRDWRAPAIRNLARMLGLPRWKISRRARQINAYQPRIKEAPWSPRELHLLELNARYTPPVIRRKLKVAGFARTEEAIKIKLSRTHIKMNCEKGSARAVAALFGVDASTIVDQWIRRGLLKAFRKGTKRTPQQGGDEWLIQDKEIRRFIVDNIGIIDLRRVDKFWFVAILTGDAAHLGDV